jgi:hypothetical protein
MTLAGVERETKPTAEVAYRATWSWGGGSTTFSSSSSARMSKAQFTPQNKEVITDKYRIQIFKLKMKV